MEDRVELVRGRETDLDKGEEDAKTCDGDDDSAGTTTCLNMVSRAASIGRRWGQLTYETAVWTSSS